MEFKISYSLKLILIGLLALVLRVVIGDIIKPVSHYSGMSGVYLQYAVNLVDYGVYSKDVAPDLKPDSLRMPLYPFFLAGLLKVVGHRFWEVSIIVSHYFLGALCCVLLAMIGKRLSNETIGLLAGLLSVFYTDYTYISITVLREILSLFMLLVCVYSLIRFLDEKRSFWGLVMACCFGLGVLVRPETILVGICLLTFYFDRLKNLFFAKKKLGILIIFLCILPLSLWTLRNGKVHGHIMPFSSDGAWSLFMGQVYPPDQAYSVADPQAMRMIREASTEWEWTSEMKQRSFEAVIRYPLRNLGWAVVKVQQTFSEFVQKRSPSLLYPIIWGLIVMVLLRPYSVLVAFVTGGAVFLLYLFSTDWRFATSITLFHVRYSDVFLTGVVGLAIYIVRNERYWKIFAACIITLVTSSMIFIAHFRARVVLVDWIFIFGSAYAWVTLLDFMKKNPLKSFRA